MSNRNRTVVTLLVGLHLSLASPVARISQAAGDAAFALRRDGPEFVVNQRTWRNQSTPSIAKLPGAQYITTWYGQDEREEDISKAEEIYVWANELAPGRALSEEIRVNEQSGISNNYHSEVGAAADGSFVIAWDNQYLQDGSEEGVFARRFASLDLRLDEEFQVNSYTDLTQETPRIAVHDDGSFVVIWEDKRDKLELDRDHIAAQFYGSDGARVGGELHLVEGPQGWPRTPQIARLPENRFVLTWTENVGGDSDFDDDVFFRIFESDGSPMIEKARVNTYRTNQQRFSHVASCDLTGEFVVVWQSFYQDGSGSGIFGQRFSPDGSPDGEEFQVNTYTLDDQVAPVPLLTPSCNLIVAWSSFGQDGDDWGVFLRRIPEDSEDVQVNQYTADLQGGTDNMIDLAADGDGRFLVVWSSVGQDGDGTAVAAQAFCQDSPALLGCGKPTCPSYVPDGERSRDELPSSRAADALFVLKAAVGLGDCPACYCDANGSGLVTAIDSLGVLRVAVGLMDELQCPACDQ